MKDIKKYSIIILFFICCVSSFVLTGCVNNIPRDEQLCKAMKELNDKCPIDAGMIGELRSIHQEDSTFILTYSVAEDFKNKAWGNADNYLNPDVAYLDLIIANDNSLNSFCKSALKKGFSIKEVFKFTFENGITTSLTEYELLPAEYNKIIDSSIPDHAKKILQKRMENENNAYKIAMQTQSYSALTDSFYIVGHIVKQEDLEIVKLTPDNMRAGLKKAFHDPSMISFANECIVCGIGISFVYKSESDSLSVDFTKEQLKVLIGR